MNGSSHLHLKFHFVANCLIEVLYFSLILTILIADLQSVLNLKKDGSDKVALSSTNATSNAPSTHILSKTDGKTGSLGELTREPGSLNSRGRFESCTSSGSDRRAGVVTFSGPSLSPSSSIGSLSSEKSTLNPNAKV